MPTNSQECTEDITSSRHHRLALSHIHTSTAGQNLTLQAGFVIKHGTHPYAKGSCNRAHCRTQYSPWQLAVTAYCTVQHSSEWGGIYVTCMCLHVCGVCVCVSLILEDQNSRLKSIASAPNYLV